MMRRAWMHIGTMNYSTTASTMATASSIHKGLSGKTSSVYSKLKVGPMKRLYKYYTPTSINLAGGVPMNSTFPFESLDVHLPGNDSFTVDRGTTLAINYQRGDGMPALKEWINKHVNSVLKPVQEVSSCVTIGNTDALFKILMLVECDSVLFDEFAYGHAMTTCETLSKKPIGVKIDDQGIVPSALRETVLAARAKGLSANLLYSIPSGHNPTGLSASAERKRHIYEVCQELDIIIVEDDAYYYLNYDVRDGQPLPGTKSLPPTFLSMDTEGRVLRLDSLSKTLSPGLRIGWITAPADFLDKYMLLQEISSQFPSGFSQSVLAGLVAHWSEDRLHAHMQQIQAHYKSQRDVTVAAIRKHFTPEQISFVNPTCGMFIWLTFQTSKTSFELFQLFAEVGVITVPASDFFVPGVEGRPLVEQGSSAVRLTFAASTAEQIERAVGQMAAAFRKL